MSQICFITAHLNPANHFAGYAKVLEKDGAQCKVITGPTVSNKFSNTSCEVIHLDLSKDKDHAEFYQEIEQHLISSQYIVTDIANERWAYLHQRLQNDHPEVMRYAYYDNPEPLVPGGYSKLAAKVIQEAKGVLFANANLAKEGIFASENNPVDLSEKVRVGLGFYPEHEAQKIAGMRSDLTRVNEIKASFFERHQIENSNSKIWNYIGGANQTYYQEAFPHFVDMVAALIENEPEKLENTTLLLQQHPRAVKEGSVDARLFEERLGNLTLPEGFHFVTSDLSTPDSLAICDAVFYYQTSMAAQFVLAGIPSVVQVGHEPYPDLLMKSGFAFASEPEELTNALGEKNDNCPTASELTKELGMDRNWEKNLIKAFKA